MMIGSYWRLLKKGLDFFCYFSKKYVLHSVIRIRVLFRFAECQGYGFLGIVFTFYAYITTKALDIILIFSKEVLVIRKPFVLFPRMNRALF